MDEAQTFASNQPVIWSFSQRIGRLRFLAYTNGLYLSFWGIPLLLVQSGDFNQTMGMLLTPLLIITLVFGISLVIRRSHDMDSSGWTCLIAIFVPFAIFYWTFKSGTPNDNRFGPAPPPNTLGVKILGLFLPVVVVIGILAAITIPEYDKYVKKSKQVAHEMHWAEPQILATNCAELLLTPQINKPLKANQIS